MDASQIATFVGALTGVLIGFAIVIRLTIAFIKLVTRTLKGKQANKLPAVITDLQKSFTLETHAYRTWMFSGHQKFSISKVPSGDHGPESTSLSIKGEESYPKTFTSQNSSNIYTQLDHVPLIQIHRKQTFSYTPIVPEFNPDYLTGEDDFDDMFAILSDAPKSFLKTIFEHPNIITHLKDLFYDANINIKSIDIFSINAPIHISVTEKIDAVSEQLVRRKIDQMYTVLELLPSFKARSKQKLFSSNGACLTITVTMGGLLASTFLMMHGQRYWLVFDENLWLIATLIGFGIALLICTVLMGLFAVGRHHKRPRVIFTFHSLSIILSFLLGSSGAVRWYNAAYSTAQVITKEVTITGRESVKSDDTTSYYLSIASTDMTPKYTFRVSRSQYETISDTAIMTIQEGALGYLYLKDLTPVEP